MSLEETLKNNLSKLINQNAQNVPISDQSISVRNIPDLFTNISDYNLKLTGGSITSSQTNLSVFNQINDTQYHVEASTNLTAAYSSWSEDYYLTISGGSGFAFPSHMSGNYNDFSFSIDSLVTKFDLSITDTSTNTSNFSSIPNGIRVHIPSRSALSGHILPCVQNQINDRVNNAIRNFDFKDQIKNAVDKLLK